MRNEVQRLKELQEPRALLARLEKTVHGELGALTVGAQPLLDEARKAVEALFPEQGGTRLPPKEHEARHEELLRALDELEAVLEALQLGARSGSPGAGAPRGGG
jgi:hypothetical protein